MATLIKEMLFYQRQYYKDKVKKPLFKAIVTLASRYKEPTREGDGQVAFENSRIRLDIQDYFLEHLKARHSLVAAAFRILIAQCENDGFYEFLHDLYIVELLKRGWTPTERGFPMYRYWDGDLPNDNLMESRKAYQNLFQETLEKVRTMRGENVKADTKGD